MNAIRTFAEVKNHTVTVNLPKDLKSKKVEVIIIPMEKEDEPSADETNLSELQKLLLGAPDMTAAELECIEAKRKALNQWN